MALATVEELKAYLNLAGSDENAVLASMIEGASMFVQRITGHQFEPEPADALDPPVTKTVSTLERETVSIPDMRAVTAVMLLGEPVQPWMLASGSGYVLRGDAPWTELQLVGVDRRGAGWNDLVITGRFGHDPIPSDIKDATLALAARRYRERSASWADTVADAEGGVLAYYRQLPASVKAVVDTYTIPAVA